MSKSNFSADSAKRAVALQYAGGESPPVIVASGMGYLAEQIVKVATDSGVPIYEDNSLATMLSQMQLGQEVPDSLCQAIVDIYVYFLEFDPNDPEKQSEQQTLKTDYVTEVPANRVGEDR